MISDSDLVHSIVDNRLPQDGIRMSGSHRVMVDEVSTRLSLVQERA